MSRYTITPTPPNLKPRTAAYDASDVTRRNWGKTVVTYKTQNEFDKQNSLTVRGVQNGTPGAQPVPFSLVPYLYEASQSQLYTVPQFTQIVGGILADYDRKYRVRNTTDFSPTGAVGGIFSIPYYVQAIDFNSNGDRIVLSYDFTNRVYHIYKIPYDDPSGVPIFDASGTDLLMKNDPNDPYTTYIKMLSFTANDDFTEFYVGGYTDVGGLGYPFIKRFDEELNLISTKRIYDASGSALLKGSFSYVLSLNGNLYTAGFCVNNTDFTIDGVTWPKAKVYNSATSPFFCKMNYNMNVLWATIIKYADANACASNCAALSTGELVAPITFDQGGNFESGVQWYIKEGGLTERYISATGNIMVAKLNSSTGIVTQTVQFELKGGSYFGGARGLQVFVDSNDNIFVSVNFYNSNPPYGPGPTFIPYTLNFGNGITTTITSEVVCYIVKFNNNLVAQAVFNMALPAQAGGVPYRFYNKYVSFDPAGNLNINASYTTGGYDPITINTMLLPKTSDYYYNSISYSLSNDLTTVNWYNVIENIKTDVALKPGDQYYRNAGILKVDTLNQQLIKVDERANTVTVTAAPGATLPAVSGINNSFLIFYN
jgi:hypothetical protein